MMKCIQTEYDNDNIGHGTSLSHTAARVVYFWTKVEFVPIISKTIIVEDI
jgi:hypothetical protein